MHVVPAGMEQSEHPTPPSAAVFLRHLPDSPVVNLAGRVRELTAKAVPNLSPERVSVMLVPVREYVSVPMTRQEYFLGIPYMPPDDPPYATSGHAGDGGSCRAVLLAGYEAYRKIRDKTAGAEPADSSDRLLNFLGGTRRRLSFPLSLWGLGSCAQYGQRPWG